MGLLASKVPAAEFKVADGLAVLVELVDAALAWCAWLEAIEPVELGEEARGVADRLSAAVSEVTR